MEVIWRIFGTYSLLCSLPVKVENVFCLFSSSVIKWSQTSGQQYVLALKSWEFPSIDQMVLNKFFFSGMIFKVVSQVRFCIQLFFTLSQNITWKSRLKINNTNHISGITFRVPMNCGVGVTFTNTVNTNIVYRRNSGIVNRNCVFSDC